MEYTSCIQGKSSFLFKSYTNWVSQNPVQKMYYWEGEGQGSPIPRVHFSTSKWWGNYTLLPREICAKDLVLIIQQSFPNLSIYLHTFMIFIVIINIDTNIIQRHEVIRDGREKHRRLGRE